MIIIMKNLLGGRVDFFQSKSTKKSKILIKSS